MTDDEMERLSIVFAKALQGARSVSDSVHYNHHKWIQQRIEESQARKKFWDEMRLHVAKFGAVGVVTVVFYALWLYITHELLKP